jgi:ArsR family transcriptional regulator
MTIGDAGDGHGSGVGPLAVLPTGGGSSEADDAAKAAPLFKALADPIRVQLLALVRQAPEGEACFCDLADEFDMPQSTLSHHLKILVNAGVLARERRGTWSWYRVQPEPLQTLESLLRPGGPFRHEAGDEPDRETRCD